MPVDGHIYYWFIIDTFNTSTRRGESDLLFVKVNQLTGREVKRSGCGLIYYTTLQWPGGNHEKHEKILSNKGRFPGRELNSRPPQYE
jgi:hypothetical protein